MYLFEYKGYKGQAEYSIEDNIYVGKVIHIKDLITFEGKNANELKKDFSAAVDDYLSLCKSIGKNPDKTGFIAN